MRTYKRTKKATLLMASTFLVACSVNDTPIESSESTTISEDAVVEEQLTIEEIMKATEARVDTKLDFNGDYTLDEDDLPFEEEDFEEMLFSDDFEESDQFKWLGFDTQLEVVKYSWMEPYKIRTRLNDENNFENLSEEFAAINKEFEESIDELGVKADEILEVATEYLNEEKLEIVLYDELMKVNFNSQIYQNTFELAETFRQEGISDEELFEFNLNVLKGNEQYVDLIHKYEVDVEAYDFIMNKIEQVEVQKEYLNQ